MAICSVRNWLDYMKRAARNLTGIKAFGEDQPEMENRVELTSGKTSSACRSEKLIHSYSADSLALWNANLEED